MLRKWSCLIMVLVLMAAVPATGGCAAAGSPYRIEVDIQNQITTVYRTSDGSVARQMLCSTGVRNGTPRGTFRLYTRASTDRKPWYRISKYRCYVKYATRIKGHYLFHSLPYRDKTMDSLDPVALSQLGSKASHGCVRLLWEDAKWISDHCPDGTAVRIFDKGESRPEVLERLRGEGDRSEAGLSYEEYLSDRYDGGAEGTLARGARGETVTDLQEQLLSLGFLSGEVTGSYDSATIAAVQRYQRAVGEEATGLADGALLERVGGETDVTGTYRTLVEGASGKSVRAFQETMKRLGFYEADPTGVYDAALTEALDTLCRCLHRAPEPGATQELQETAGGLLSELSERFGETDYGLAVLKTTSEKVSARKKLTLYGKANASGKRVATVPAGAEVTVLEQGKSVSRVRYADREGYVKNKLLRFEEETRWNPVWGKRVSDVGSEDMAQGMLGDGVVRLQARLRELGYLNAEPTGLYDGPTAQALRDYQRDAGLEETGEASVATQTALFDRSDITGTAVPLLEGSAGAAVETLQWALKALQYYDGEVTGAFDAATAAAVEQFTRVNGMSPTALASGEIQRAVIDQYFACEAEYGSGNYTLIVDGRDEEWLTAKAAKKITAEARKSSEKLGTLPKRGEAQVLERLPRWLRVRYGDVEGYIPAGSVTFQTRVRWSVRFEAKDPALNLIYGTLDDGTAEREEALGAQALQEGFTGLEVEEEPADSEDADDAPEGAFEPFGEAPLPGAESEEALPDIDLPATEQAAA